MTQKNMTSFMLDMCLPTIFRSNFFSIITGRIREINKYSPPPSSF